MEHMSISELKATALSGAREDLRVADLSAVLGDRADQCLLVGGCVRDFALGRTPLELDVVVLGSALELVGSLGLQSLEIHERFLTASCVFGWGRVDFASARRETYAHSGALPTVEAASLDEDLLRRDFTVNALTMPIGASEIGDWPAAELGWEDLAGRQLRVLHEQSFIDDPTRLWRMARYAARCGLTPEAVTRGLAEAAVEGRFLERVNASRSGSELLRTVDAREPASAIINAGNIGLLSFVGGSDRGVSQLDNAAGRFPDLNQERLRLAAVWWQAGAPTESRTALIGALSLGGQVTELAAQACDPDDLFAGLNAATRPSQIARACSSWAHEVVALASSPAAADPASRWLSDLRHIESPVGARELMAVGVPEGPLVGLGLEAGLAYFLDSEGASDVEVLEAATSAVRDAGWRK